MTELDVFDIVVPEDRLSERGGKVTGQIFVGFGGSFFPQEGWFDFPVIVLSWWLERIDTYNLYKEKCVQFDFMDGPNSIILEGNGDRFVVALECRSSVEEYQILGEVHVALVENNLIAEISKVISVCEKKSIHTEDLILLKNTYSKIQSRK